MSDQIPTRACTIESVMRSASFTTGVDDVRSGSPPNFDDQYDDWSYERGRQWASLAPISLELKIDGKLNPKAVALYRVALRRGYIR
jgi:hypothetical protein